MASDGSDFRFIMAIAIIAVLWSGFNVLYLNQELDSSSSPLPGYSQQSGFLATLWMASDFLNPFSDNFNSDYFLVNFLVFGILIFGILVVALRYIRG